MPKIKFTQRFLDSYAKLPTLIQEKIKKQIFLLSEDPRHPSLQTKPIQGAPGIFEARVDVSYRMTYERDVENSLVLRVVGKHDRTLKKP